MIVTLKAYATLTLHFVHFHIVSLAANSINIKHFPVSAERDLSPVRRRNRNSDDDLSPARKANRSDRDLSPVRRKNRSSDDDLSPVRRRNKHSDSPPRRPKENTRSQKHHDDNSDDERSKMKRTLDGKRAGLQNAKLLKEETEEFRRREDDLFKKMSNDVSGRNADVVVRDKKSGRVRDLEKEREKDEEKQRREKERQEVYSRWGKGLKQVEDYRSKVADDQHESNKPLARFADDDDLDKMLREKEHADDPMLEYMRQKNAKKSNAPKVPTYNGPFPENRFNIRPGYRWDGVDRSNGYEKKWINVQSQKTAVQEEAYRYSTEDM